jgi:hypothetical protein
MMMVVCYAWLWFMWNKLFRYWFMLLNVGKWKYEIGGIVFNHDCDSCEIKCLDIGLCVVNIER